MVREALNKLVVQISINGDPVDGLLHASIETSNHFSSDSFALTFAMGPLFLRDITYWSALKFAYVEVTVQLNRGPISQALISGMIDSLSLDPICRTVALEGRDLSATLIDSYREQDFVNQSASDVVTTVAEYHGLTPIVSPTFGSVGRYYGDGYTRLSLGQSSRIRSDWDLVVQLARENGFDVFVESKALFFQPSTILTTVPIQISSAKVYKLTLQRALSITSDATARVQSWNSQNMMSYDSSGLTEQSGGVSLNDGVQPFLFAASNLTPQQVSDAADRYGSEISRLGMTLHVEMPWDLALAPRTIILVDDTGSSFDGLYRVEQIERHFSTTSGSYQVVRAAMI